MLIALALALAAASVALSARHLRRVRSVDSIDLDALVVALKRVPFSDRVEYLAAHAPAGSWEHDLALEILAADDEPARRGAANGALADLDHRLGATEGWPAAALRLAIYGALMLGAVAYITATISVILPILSAGAVGALVSAETGRRARQVASRKRAAVDRLITTLLPQHASKAPTTRLRRRSR